MAIQVISEFVRKDTIRLIQYVQDDDEALVDATSVDISIVDPAGTVVVDEAAMNKTATGTYEYFLVTTISFIEGDYQIEADITDSSYHTAGVNE
ncbi:hypothetical protein LCGC14_1744510 [marine sediment metagenome]|uniref:BppU N-terminal domain-containing protein n=1 Tax=marine sediment metagenome TaxID=412755 RepID=A0A0F9H5R8_9ZZZZ